MNVRESDISNMTQGYMGEISKAITTDTAKAKTAFSETLKTLATDMMSGYAEENKSLLFGNMAQIKMSDVDAVVNTFMAKDTTKAALAKLEAEYLVPQDAFAEIYSPLLKGAWQGYITYWNSLSAGNSDDENVGNENLGTDSSENENRDSTDASAPLSADTAKLYLRCSCPRLW